MAALCIGVSPPLPLKSIWAPPDNKVGIQSTLPFRPHATPNGVSSRKFINFYWQKIIGDKITSV